MEHKIIDPNNDNSAMTEDRKKAEDLLAMQKATAQPPYEYQLLDKAALAFLPLSLQASQTPGIGIGSAGQKVNIDIGRATLMAYDMAVMFMDARHVALLRMEAAMAQKQQQQEVK